MTWPRNRVEVPCSNCDKILERKPYRLRRSTHHYCSAACASAHRSKMQKGKPRSDYQPPARNAMLLICEICSREFERPQYKVGKHNYCGKGCAAKAYAQKYKGSNHALHNQVEVVCGWCGIGITVNPSRTDKTRFCSRACANAAHSVKMSGENSPRWRGGDIAYYGPNWQAQRRAARKRDNYCCQCCGISEKKLMRQLDVHHIVAFRVFGEANYLEANQLSNLISLCIYCHRAVEDGKKAVQLKML
jgi:5-methylcytosine-specific restriction endonuclease McrA